ncbi:transcriptional repressor [Synergistales bacterium]|nr:transcriptional repressor [Synergistales bacterium]
MGRNTHQKQSILNALASLHGQHPTAEMVYERVSQTIPSLSRATVYRVLNGFAGQGVILQIHTPESGYRYDDVTSPHYHLLCDVCKRVVDLLAPRLEKIPLPQEDVSGCRITGVELMFFGVCPDCARQTIK